MDALKRAKQCEAPLAPTHSSARRVLFSSTVTSDEKVYVMGLLLLVFAGWFLSVGHDGFDACDPRGSAVVCHEATPVHDLPLLHTPASTVRVQRFGVDFAQFRTLPASCFSASEAAAVALGCWE